MNCIQAEFHQCLLSNSTLASAIAWQAYAQGIRILHHDAQASEELRHRSF
jgi:hypothetical protein